MHLTDGTPRARLTLALDLSALVLFVVAGMRNHRTGTAAEIFLRNAVPVIVAWLVASITWRTYRPPVLKGLVLTWLTAVPVGLLVRTWWVGSPSGTRIAVFLGVGLAFTGVFLLGARVIAVVMGRRSASREPV